MITNIKSSFYTIHLWCNNSYHTLICSCTKKSGGRRWELEECEPLQVLDAGAEHPQKIFNETKSQPSMVWVEEKEILNRRSLNDKAEDKAESHLQLIAVLLAA